MSADAAPIYIETYNKLRANGRYRFKVFVESLEFESGYRERLVLFEDIITGNTANLRHIFSDSKLEDLASFALSELTSLPKETIRDNRDLFNIILEWTLDGKYPAKDKVLSTLYAIFAQQHGAYETRYMLNMIFDPRMPEEFRILFTMALVSMGDVATNINWANYDLKQNNFLIPGYLLHNYRTNAFEAFKSLRFADPAFVARHAARLKYPIRKILETLAIANVHAQAVMNIALEDRTKVIYDIIDENQKIDNKIRSYLAKWFPDEEVAIKNVSEEEEEEIKAVKHAINIQQGGNLKEQIDSRVDEADDYDNE